MNNPYEEYYKNTPETPQSTPQQPSTPPAPPVNDEPVTVAAPYNRDSVFSDTSQFTPPQSPTPQQPTPQPPSAQEPDYTVDEYYRENFSGSDLGSDSYGAGSYNSYPEQPAPVSRYDGYTSSSNTEYTNKYSDSSYNSAYQNPYTSYPSEPIEKPRKPRAERNRKEPKPVTRSALVIVLLVSILSSMLIGAGGGWFAANYLSGNKTDSSDGLTVNKSDSEGSSYASSTAALTTTEIVEKTADAVVEITTESVVTSSFSQQYIQSGAGSGVIISKDGYIITNYHVIEDASHITVTLRDQTEFKDVEVVGTYSAGDIALLKVESKKDLTAATLGDSSKIKVGDYAVVIGNPLGQLGGSVTDGIISALDRELTIDDQTMNLLQTNAEISPGNSGGGLFNGNGELIGIVNAKSSSNNAEGIGFAIPINDVQDVLSDLKQYGYVKGQVDLGMSLAEVNSTAQLWMYGVNQTGVYVAAVSSGSNAEKAGFRYGDIITAVDGTNVSSKAELNAIIKKHSVGDKVTFTVYRNGNSGQITMELAEYTKESSSSFSSSSSDDDEGGSVWDIFN